MYVARDGSERRYASYVCPGFLGGQCANSTRVPEEWIRTVVINKLRGAALPGDVIAVDALARGTAAFSAVPLSLFTP